MKRVVIAVSVLLSSRVSAQPSGGDAGIAREYTQAALVASKNDDFETAVDLYSKAYAIAAHPVLLWDIAQAHRRAAEKLHDHDAARASLHRDAAREFFRRFLDTRPDEDMEGKARVWLAKLDAQWTEEHPREEAARRADDERRREAAIRLEQARLDAERTRIAERDRLEQQRIHSAVDRTASAAQRDQARTLKLAGAAGIVAGLAGLGAGAYFGVKAHRIASDLSARDVYDPARIEDGHTAERSMAIACIAGGAVLTGGLVTYWVGRRIDARAEHATVSVAPAGGGAIVGVAGQF